MDVNVITEEQLRFFIETVNVILGTPSGGKEVGQLLLNMRSTSAGNYKVKLEICLLYEEHLKSITIYRKTFVISNLDDKGFYESFTQAYYDILTALLCSVDGAYFDTHGQKQHVLSFATLLRDGLKSVEEKPVFKIF